MKSKNVVKSKRVVIAGAGRAGSLIAKWLSRDSDIEVVLIDEDKDALDRLMKDCDISSRLGDVLDLNTIQDTLLQGCDLFVSVLGDEKINLIAGTCAKGFQAKSVAAVVSDEVFLRNEVLYESILGVDYLLSPDHLAASDIADFVEYPGALVAESYGNDRIQFFEVRVYKKFKHSGKTLKEIMDSLKGKFVIGYLQSGKEVILPDGETKISSGDIVGLFGKRDDILKNMKVFTGDWEKKKRVAILGGSNITLSLVRLLKDKVNRVRIFEKDRGRANELSELLKSRPVDIVNGDPLDDQTMFEEVKDYDVFVSPTNDDERNLLASLIAKDIGIPYSVSVVYNMQFAEVMEKFGVDLAVVPYVSLANKVLRIVYNDIVGHLLSLRGVEIAEYSVNSDFKYLNRPLKDIRPDLGGVVAGIIRGETAIIPVGDTEIKEGDRVVLVCRTEDVEEMNKKFLG